MAIYLTAGAYCSFSLLSGERKVGKYRDEEGKKNVGRREKRNRAVGVDVVNVLVLR